MCAWGSRVSMQVKDSKRKLSLVMIVYANLGMLSVDVRNVSTLGK